MYDTVYDSRQGVVSRFARTGRVELRSLSLSGHIKGFDEIVRIHNVLVIPARPNHDPVPSYRMVA